MRIACICNINHAQYILARYLRDMGHQVTLFLMEEYAHFYPENDSYGPVTGIEVVELPWKHKEIYHISKKEIAEKLGGFDVYCGSEFAPAFLFKAGIKMDIYVPIGTDLIDYPFAKPKGFVPDTWAIDEYQFHLFQKGGIKNAAAVFMNLGGDKTLENALKKVKFRGRRIPFSLPYLYLPEYRSALAVSTLEPQIAELRKQYGLLLISHGRCEFVDKNSLHNKGTDLLLRALAAHISQGNANVGLVMLEYGSDWKAAQVLARELGIENHVHWLPQCGRREIFPVLKYFDAAMGVLSYPHWSYNVAMEVIAAGLPLIKKAAENDTERQAIYPAIEVQGEQDLVNVLQRLANKEEEVKAIAAEGRNWFDSAAERALGTLHEILGTAGLRPKSAQRIFSRERLQWFVADSLLRACSILRWKLQRLRIQGE